MSKRLDESWEKWTIPENLGESINTSGMDAYFTIPASGDIAYFVSSDSSNNGTDIYLISLNKEQKPQPVGLISGKIFNLENKNIDANLNIYSNNNLLYEFKSVNEYKITLEIGKKYIIYATKNENSVSQTIDLTNYNQYVELKKDILFNFTENNTKDFTITIYFDFNNKDIKSDFKKSITNFINSIKEINYSKIQIEGNTDSKGDDKFNLKLSKARSESVSKLFIESKISKNKIKIIANGSRNPIAGNDTEEGMQKNRRVEIKIIK